MQVIHFSMGIPPVTQGINRAGPTERERRVNVGLKRPGRPRADAGEGTGPRMTRMNADQKQNVKIYPVFHPRYPRYPRHPRLIPP
jgi:hypothetical protein